MICVSVREFIILWERLEVDTNARFECHRVRSDFRKGQRIIQLRGYVSFSPWWYIQLKHSRTANCITKPYVDQPGLESHHSNMGNSAVSVERLAKCFKNKNLLIRCSFGNVNELQLTPKIWFDTEKNSNTSSWNSEVLNRRNHEAYSQEVFWEFKGATHFPTDYFGDILNRSVSSIWHQRLPIKKLDITKKSGAKV